jgi:hypothetical protein
VNPTGSESNAIAKIILVARDRAVLLDADLAALFGVSTKALNQAVKRNISRFPPDFAFQLTRDETTALNKLRGALSTQRHRDPRNPPYAFTEHGAIMLAMILKSTKAIEISVFVVRAFATLREAARANNQLMTKLKQLEDRVGKHDADIEAILAAMRKLMTPPERKSRGIAYLAEIK